MSQTDDAIRYYGYNKLWHQIVWGRSKTWDELPEETRKVYIKSSGTFMPRPPIAFQEKWFIQFMDRAFSQASRSLDRALTSGEEHTQEDIDEMVQALKTITEVWNKWTKFLGREKITYIPTFTISSKPKK